MGRVYNFSAGPAVLPEEVLKEAADEMMDYQGSGMSVMEMSHRSKVYDNIIKEAEADLRELMNIPGNNQQVTINLIIIFKGVIIYENQKTCFGSCVCCRNVRLLQ